MDEPPFVDDITILDSADLWRRINPLWIVPDNNQGELRISSAAFDDSPDGSPLSMLHAEVVFSTGRTAQDVLSQLPEYSLASLQAGDARAQRQAVSRTPTEEEPAHVSVAGLKTKRVKKALASAARWVIGPGNGGGV